MRFSAYQGAVTSLATRVYDRLLAILEWLDRSEQPRGFHAGFVLALLTLLYFPFRWSGNEENYFLLAYRWARPDAFGPYSAVFDHSHGKIVGFWLMGEMVAFFGYEVAHLVLMLAVVALLALALSRVVRLFDLSMLDALCILFLFYACRQTLMGGETMLSGVETKTFAYGLGMLAFADCGQRRWLRAAVLSALGTYLHFQIGGLWLGVSALFLLFDGADWRRPLMMVAVYAVLVLPEMALLLMDWSDGASVPRPAGMPSADYIYSVIRNTHHVAPFAHVNGWRSFAARGLGYTLVIFLAASRALRSHDRRIRALAKVVGLLGCYMFVAVALSWIDRDTGALGKFYLFRPACTLLLLALTMGFAVWRQTAGSAETRLMPIGAMMAVIAIQGLTTPINWQERPLDAGERAMVAAVDARTRPNDVILLDPATDVRAKITRHISRQTLVQWKFVPTNPAEIYRWWGLISAREAVFGGDCRAIDPVVSYLVATPDSIAGVRKCGTPLWANGAYALIKIR